mmetsp:Transcript_1803/g.4011  ORF Transcript_1803/g.4011 Transcript_1803/m.4011 type:complete len:250 (-) Transcript_1803:931-1680(-)
MTHVKILMHGQPSCTRLPDAGTPCDARHTTARSALLYIMHHPAGHSAAAEKPTAAAVLCTMLLLLLLLPSRVLPRLVAASVGRRASGPLASSWMETLRACPCTRQRTPMWRRPWPHAWGLPLSRRAAASRGRARPAALPGPRPAPRTTRRAPAAPGQTTRRCRPRWTRRRRRRTRWRTRPFTAWRPSTRQRSTPPTATCAHASTSRQSPTSTPSSMCCALHTCGPATRVPRWSTLIVRTCWRTPPSLTT